MRTVGQAAIARTRFACMYLRSGKVFVLSENQMPSGAHLIQDDPIAVAVHDLVGLGLAIRKQIDAYRTDVTPPDGWWLPGDKMPNLYGAAGVKSQATFRRTATLVSVKWDAGQLVFAPWRKVRGGYEPIHGHDRPIASDCSNQQIGEAAIAAFGDAEQVL